MPEDIKHFPALKRLLAECWEAATKQRHGNLSLREAASEMGMNSPSALHSWLRGERVPKSNNQKKLAEFFFPDDADAQQQFIEDVEASSQVLEGPRVPDPLDELMSGQRKLRLGVVDYGAFGGNDSSLFFNDLFARFAAFAGLTKGGMEIDVVDLTEVMELLCTKGRLDVVLGVLATPDRAMRMKFFMTPITIPVSAVAVSADQTKLSEAGQALLKRTREGTRVASYVRPIVNKMEVGGLHARNFLSLAETTEFSSVKYEVQAYLNELLQRSEKLERGAPLPVVLADELMCLQVIAIAEKDGEHSPLRLLSKELDTQFGGMPSYRLAFAVNRLHTRWIDYLQDAFSIYLNSNNETVLWQYTELYNSLVNHFPEHQDRFKHWLGAQDTPFRSDVDPWVGVLHQFRERFEQETPRDDVKPSKRKSPRTTKQKGSRK